MAVKKKVTKKKGVTGSRVKMAVKKKATKKAPVKKKAAKKTRKLTPEELHAKKHPPTPRKANRRSMTPERVEFVRQVLSQGCRWNLTEAARKAGYKNPTSTGSALARDPQIKAILEDQMEKALRAPREYFRYCVTQELIDIAASRVGDYLDDNGNIVIKNVKNIRPGAIREYRRDEKGRTVIKVHDKLAAITKLASLLGFDVEKPGGGGDDSDAVRREILEIYREAARERDMERGGK